MQFRLLTSLVIQLCFALPVFAQYNSLDDTCDGLPKLPIGSMPDTCVGILVNSDAGFIKPRKTIQVANESQLLVTDMGGWADHRGALWLVDFYTDKKFSGAYRVSRVLEKLRLPHDIKRAEDGYYYLGEAHQISRFKFSDKKLSALEVVVTDLPFEPDAYQHPLTSFVFLPNNNLLVNVGSKTDACRDSLSANKVCEEVANVGLRQYEYEPEKNRWQSQFSMYATGLRNSMALVTHSSGTVLQGENSSDLDSADEPYEEINIIQQGGFYGWPYCLNRQFDQNTTDKGCLQANYIEPHTLMPPHVAPLDMIYYNSTTIPALTGKLLVGWHGYRVVGNRIVAYAVNANGVPYLTDTAVFNRDPIAPATEFTQHPFQPAGGLSVDAQHVEVIQQWNAVSGLRPEGAPVGLLELSDGTLLITDDKNKSLLRIAPGTPYEGTNNPPLIPNISGIKMTDNLRELFKARCALCHIELTNTPGLLLNKAAWLRHENGVPVLATKLTQNTNRMPPDFPLEPEQLSQLLDAIDLAND